ncbi:hypothetical protein GE09DRAFT_511048 [Coniochaeta sp. 2T2.1]|nr:hypothetical protein GE09DRAFT_511048 [Coniochaeta sp. 2T2.1]
MADPPASASTSAGSSNPFRRKPTSAPGVPSSASISIDPIFESSSDSLDLPAQQPNTSDFLRQQLQALPHTNEPPPSTTFQKPKVVKKVRVQSPPPSSPESAGAPHGYPAYGYPEEDSESTSSDDDEGPEDPFRGMAPAPPLAVIGQANHSAPDTAPPVSAGPPPNPFKKTLEDMEHGSNDGPQIPNASTGGKGSLDVDAFKRLLMTGQTNASGSVTQPAVPSPSTHKPPSLADAASITDASSVSRQSIFDSTVAQETPRTSHEISEAEGEDDRLGLIHNAQAKTQQTASTLRKKPPPPSPRHGKLIKVDLSKKENTGSPGHDGDQRPSSSSSQTIVPGSPSSTSSRRRSSTPSDVNKPLPPAPGRRSIDDGSESIFDREAAGKVPEPVDPELDADAIPTPRPPTPPNASHATTATTDLNPSDPRKPPPPPRRKSHSRNESKLSVASKSSTTPVPTFTDEPSSMRRSSQDSTRSVSSSLRVNLHAPAPPPPRRPNHASRPSFSASSAASFTGLTPTNASAATSPAPSDGEHPSFHSPVPFVASPDPLSSGQTSLSASGIPTPATALAPMATKPRMPPPPLPPARNTSVRVSTGRPASLRSVDAPSRRVKDGSAPSSAPPPPPPPKRSRAGSGRDRGALLGGPVTEEPEPTSLGDVSVRVSEEKSADEILADLSALQREVDALRGKYEKNPSGV